MNFKPSQDRILIKRLKQEDKTKSGIIIPDTAKEKSIQGKVIAVGPGLKNNDGTFLVTDIKVGDVVVFAKWGGTEIKLQGNDYIIMKESDILGIVN